MYMHIQVGKTPAQQKQHLQKIYRKVRDKENEALHSPTAQAVLVEDESIKGYQRKRLLHFKTPPAKRQQKSPKSHSPNFDNVTWDKKAVLQDLRQYPPAPPAINWQEFARSHSIPGKNCGQVVKEFAQKSGIDTFQLDGLTPGRKTRISKRKLQGGEISAPAPPTPRAIKQEWNQMIQRGELSLGVPCTPFTLTQYTISDGKLNKKTIEVIGRKFPLQEVRQKLLQSQQRYMKLNTDDELEDMTDTQLHELVSLIHLEFEDGISGSELREVIKTHQRTRNIIVWHDHATILGLGCITITAHIAYDTAVFYTQTEWNRMHDEEQVDIQSTIEQPVFYMVAASSSSMEDQASLLPDRLECLQTLSEPVTTSTNVDIQDQMRFFVGDHPAQQFERGTQQGGFYKCGGCGAKSTLMDDLAYTLQRATRSLSDLQKIATSGKLGKKAGELN